MTDAIVGKCDICSKAAKQCCSSCKLVYYCSKECQKKGWKDHKPKCRPFSVQQHPVYGRYATATRDIKPGEIFLKEAPIVIGPKQCTKPLCLGCHKMASGSAFCKRCKFPLCSPSCHNSRLHKDECPILAKASSLTFKDFNSSHPAYECITPLRCLLLKKSDPKKWETLISLQSHFEDIQNTALYNVNRRNIVDFIRIFLGYTEADEETIHRICGILVTNSFELIQNGQRVRGIYNMSSMLAHNCVPNTKHAIDNDKNIIFRATTKISKGSPLYVTYAPIFADTYTRRTKLKAAKFFLCNCNRCSDPTELDTDFSTLLCSKCGGEIRSEDPLESEASWLCLKCGHRLLGKQIKWANEALNNELRGLGRIDPHSLETFVERYKKALHPNHRFNVEAKYALIKLYGNNKGFYYKDLSQEQIDNKVSWCKELLQLADIIDPCKSLLRGTLLFELQAATVAQAKFLLSNDLITEKNAGEYMTEAVALLQEASEILKHEPEMADGGLDKKLNWLSRELEI